MREAVFAVLLVLSAFAGCLQEGDEIQETDVDAPDNESDTDQGQQDGDTTDSSDESSDDTTTETTNQTSSDDGSGNQTAGSDDGSDKSDDGPDRVPWNLTKEIRLGFMAGVGAHFLPSAVTDQLAGNGIPTEAGLSEDPYCPRANVTVPQSADTLSVSLDGALVDAEEPGVGAYELAIEGPSGTNATIGGLDAIAPAPVGGGSMNWSAQDVTRGVWTLDVNMVGPVVQQTWTATVHVNGTATNAPTELPLELVCS